MLSLLNTKSIQNIFSYENIFFLAIAPNWLSGKYIHSQVRRISIFWRIEFVFSFEFINLDNSCHMISGGWSVVSWWILVAGVCRPVPVQCSADPVLCVSVLYLAPTVTSPPPQIQNIPHSRILLRHGRGPPRHHLQRVQLLFAGGARAGAAASKRRNKSGSRYANVITV